MSKFLITHPDQFQRGFILVEVMMAVIILSVCLVAIVQSILGVVRTTSEIAHYRKVIVLGQNAFFQLVQPKAPSEPAQEAVDPQTFEVKTQDGQLDPAVALEGLSAKAISVSWTQGQHQKQVEFQTYVWSPPTQEGRP